MGVSRVTAPWRLKHSSILLKTCWRIAIWYGPKSLVPCEKKKMMRLCSDFAFNLGINQLLKLYHWQQRLSVALRRANCRGFRWVLMAVHCPSITKDGTWTSPGYTLVYWGRIMDDCWYCLSPTLSLSQALSLPSFLYKAIEYAPFSLCISVTFKKVTTFLPTADWQSRRRKRLQTFHSQISEDNSVSQFRAFSTKFFTIVLAEELLGLVGLHCCKQPQQCTWSLISENDSFRKCMQDYTLRFKQSFVHFSESYQAWASIHYHNPQSRLTEHTESYIQYKPDLGLRSQKQKCSTNSNKVQRKV